MIEVYLLKYYFESHHIYKWRHYRQTIFNQLNIMVPYVDIIGLCPSLAILWEIYVIRHKCNVRWLRFHFKWILIMGLGQLALCIIYVFTYKQKLWQSEKRVLLRNFRRLYILNMVDVINAIKPTSSLFKLIRTLQGLFRSKNILPRHWPRIMAPRCHFYLIPGNQTTSSLNCTSFVIEKHCMCTRYKLSLFWAKVFPLLSTFLCLPQDRASRYYF